MISCFAEKQNCRQNFLLPTPLDYYVCEVYRVRVFEPFMDKLDLAILGIFGETPSETGRPA